MYNTKQCESCKFLCKEIKNFINHYSSFPTLILASFWMLSEGHFMLLSEIICQNLLRVGPACHLGNTTGKGGASTQATARHLWGIEHPIQESYIWQMHQKLTKNAFLTTTFGGVLAKMEQIFQKTRADLGDEIQFPSKWHHSQGASFTSH